MLRCYAWQVFRKLGYYLVCNFCKNPKTLPRRCADVAYEQRVHGRQTVYVPRHLMYLCRLNACISSRMSDTQVIPSYPSTMPHAQRMLIRKVLQHDQEDTFTRKQVKIQSFGGKMTILFHNLACIKLEIRLEL